MRGSDRDSRYSIMIRASRLSVFREQGIHIVADTVAEFVGARWIRTAGTGRFGANTSLWAALEASRSPVRFTRTDLHRQRTEIAENVAALARSQRDRQFESIPLRQAVLRSWFRFSRTGTAPAERATEKKQRTEHLSTRPWTRNRKCRKSRHNPKPRFTLSIHPAGGRSHKRGCSMASCGQSTDKVYSPACAATAFCICCLTASILKLAPFCIGGNSMRDCAA